MYVRAANMYKMAKNWCGKNIFALNLYMRLSMDNCLKMAICFPAAGNAFSQAARLHLQMQSKHDAATNFIDAGNAFKKADPQGNDYDSPFWS